jgi:hypothetical protein
MANLKIQWALPTTRESGKPLAIDAIQHVEISLSADGGANYGVIDLLPPSMLETIVQDVEPGTWFAQGVVVDTAGRRSAPVTASAIVEDNSPPGALTALVLSVE